MRILCILGLLGASAALAAGPLSFSSGPSQVALIELFTSEGCSSCPPADRWLGELRDKPGLWKEFVPVEFHVNYWDSLGWRDRLSSTGYTSREYAYASEWGSRSVYTPCFVRNGSEWKPMWGGPASAGGAAGQLKVELAGGACRVEYLPGSGSPGHRASYEVHVALLGGGISSRVTAGENSGETLKHEFVVLGLADAELVPEAGGPGVRASLAVPTAVVPDGDRRALAAWVTRKGELAPIQATGGWLP